MTERYRYCVLFTIQTVAHNIYCYFNFNTSITVISQSGRWVHLAALKLRTIIISFQTTAANCDCIDSKGDLLNNTP